MRKERNLIKYCEVIKIENQTFNFTITIVSLLANIFTIISFFKNSNQTSNYFIQQNQVNINNYNTSQSINNYVYSQNKQTINKIISYFFHIIFIIIFIYNSYIEIHNIMKPNGILTKFATTMNTIFISILTVVNNSIFSMTLLIILFFFSSNIIFIVSKNFKLLSIHSIIMLSFIYLAYNIKKFNISMIKITSVNNSIIINHILEELIKFIPILLAIYLICIYWGYIEQFIKKEYNLNLIKDKIKIYRFYFLCLLSIVINLIFFYYL